MKKMIQNESGVAHLLLIVVFVAAFAGLGTLAYTRVNDSNSSKEVAELIDDGSDLNETVDEEQKLSPEEEAESSVEE